MPGLSRRAALGLAAAAVLAGCSRSVTKAVRSTSGPAPSETTPPPAATSTTPPPTQTPPPAPTPTPTPTLTGPSVEYVHGDRARAEVALTFHGAGEPALARQLLDLLAARHTVATVMVVGSWLAANPTLAAAITAGGHELGNHTWTHPVLSDLGEAAIRSEIQQCRDLLVRLTGQPGVAFRQSSAQYSTPLIRQVAGSLGYPTCLSYDVDSLDWTDPGAATVRRSVATAQAGSVISLHLGHAVTIAALPGVLDDLAARGLTPVTVSRLLTP